MTVEKLAEGYGLIEGPVWQPGVGLHFADVLFGGVFCLDANRGVTEVFEHRRGIGGMSLHEAGGMVVSGRNVAYKSFAGGDTVTLIEQDTTINRVGFNDITADAAGRVYAGSLGSSPVFDDGREPQAGDLYVIDLDGSWRIVANDVQLTNGLGFSPDGKTLYHSDTGQATVFRYDWREDGSLGEKTPFVGEQGVDGLVVSEDGAVWVALASSGCVAVYEPNGDLRERIEIPLPMCTSVCFGGDDLKDLYIVTGSNGVEGDRRGTVFCHRTNVAGLEVPLAKVKVS
jgi:gluconolactonase